jgi:hypothetical protein
MPDIAPLKRAPITSAPTTHQAAKWSECLRLFEQAWDRTFAIELQSEALIAKAVYAQSKSVGLSLPGSADAEQRFLLLKKTMIDLQSAISGVQRGEYGLRWRDNDFDILSPQTAMGALFIPLLVGGLIVAGCLVTLYHLGESSSKLLVDYQKLNKAADSALCSDPNSELCKGWAAVKEVQHIEEKESFADSLKGGLSKGITVALALVGIMLALSIFKRQ